MVQQVAAVGEGCRSANSTIKRTLLSYFVDLTEIYELFL
jgi:hypothetical protein